MVGRNILIRKANNLAKKKKDSECSITYAEARTIGIIFTVDDLSKHNQVKAFIKKLNDDGKKVEVMSFLPKGLENHEFIFNFFTDKDISFLGNYDNQDILSFTRKKFDFIFCVDIDPDPLLESLLAMTSANCRIGFYRPEKKHFYELMIQPSEHTTEGLIKEMLKYIKILR